MKPSGSGWKRNRKSRNEAENLKPRAGGSSRALESAKEEAENYGGKQGKTERSWRRRRRSGKDPEEAYTAILRRGSAVAGKRRLRNTAKAAPPADTQRAKEGAACVNNGSGKEHGFESEGEILKLAVEIAEK